jgi:hypothetical protein
MKFKPQIELRAKMSEEYSIDLRSKSDAQVAEVHRRLLRRIHLRVTDHCSIGD